MSAQSDPGRMAETINIGSGNHTMTKAPACRGIYVGGDGDLVVVMAGDGQTQTFLAVPAGAVLPVQATAVVKAGTNASNMVALF